jgi:hypothetical protein
MRRLAVVLFLLLPNALPLRAQTLDWKALDDEALHTLSDYVKVNTTNPPGNELDGARFLKAILDREGIEAQLYGCASMCQVSPGMVHRHFR